MHAILEPVLISPQMRLQGRRVQVLNSRYVRNSERGEAVDKMRGRRVQVLN
jgi:hypothetical protein